MSARALDHLRLVRPIPRGARPMRVLARRIAVIAAVDATLAVGGAAAAALVCLISAQQVLVLGVLLAITFAVAVQKVRARRNYVEAARKLTPVLLLYTHDRLQRKRLRVSKRPDDYVYEAFRHLLNETLQENRRRSMMSTLCSTIDVLITRDVANADHP